MSKKRNKFVAAILAAGLTITGCKDTSTEALEPNKGNSISYETDNHEVYHQIKTEKEVEKRNKKIERIKELMEMCETMASQSVDSHHVGAIITQFEQENREQDAKGYTEWTNPDGELHSSESRLYQDVYNMLKNIDKYRLLKLGDNTYGLDNPKGGGIHSDDVLSSRFMDENNIRINVDESKIFVLLLLKDSFNNFMEKMGLKCAMDLRVPANLNGKALDPNVIQSDNLYVNFNGEDKELVEELNEIAERWMRCTFSADEPSEFVALFLNGMLYNRATENPIFAEWLMNLTTLRCSYEEYSSNNNSTTFDFLSESSEEYSLDDSCTIYYNSDTFNSSTELNGRVNGNSDGSR